tara:strand:+ start:176 stop:370 length:195 start_codon:yes stop_codon:yes gene_type:complete
MKNEIANLEYGKDYNNLTEGEKREVDYQTQETQEDAVIYNNIDAYIKMLDKIYDKYDNVDKSAK